MAPWFERWLWHAWCWHFSPDVIRGSCTKRVKKMYHLTLLFCPRWHVCLGTPFRKVQTEGIRFWACGWRYFCSFRSCLCTFWVHAWFHHSRYLLVWLKCSCRVCVCFVLLLWCGHGACWLRLHEDSSDGLACLLMLYWYWWWLSRVANDSQCALEVWKTLVICCDVGVATFDLFCPRLSCFTCAERQ